LVSNSNALQDFPRELQWMSYLQEWHVRGTKIRQLPDYLALFTQLAVLEIPKNAISELPPEIGENAARAVRCHDGSSALA